MSAKDESTVRVSQRTYDLVRNYVEYMQSQDNKVKSDDDRIFTLLAKEVRISDFITVLGYIKHFIPNIPKNPENQYLFLRDTTANYLYVYCFIRGYRNLNEGIYHLIEKAMNDIQRQIFKNEYAEVMKQHAK